MKASYNWLKELCEFDLAAHELAERLSDTGFNVETYEPHGDDWSLDVEVTTNRPDCLCHLGLAREVAAIVGSAADRPQFELPENPDDAFDDRSAVEVVAPELCPQYTARLITGVSIGSSPGWLQDRLTACGVRPVNNVVDATNYVMLECGQPLHAFDFSLLEGGRIIVRRAEAGEILTTIDDVEHELVGEECVIADAAQPVALAGVMGGLESEIRDSTTTVLLEAARFDPASIRRTARRHGMSTESSYRFERGIDPEITEWASRRVCALICELAGGRVASGGANVRADETACPEVSLRLPRLELVLGISPSRDEAKRIFRGLGLKLTGEDETSVTVRVPSWRADLRREIDLIEEIARIHGYDKISETTSMPVRLAAARSAERARRKARRLLTGAGFNEAITHSLVRADDLQTAQPWTDRKPPALRNPVSTERTHMRLTNVANLLLARQFNQAHGTPSVDFFEFGRVYLPLGEDERPEEKLCLTLLTDRSDGLRVLKGLLANLTDELGIDAEIEETPEDVGPCRSGEALTMRMDGRLLGFAGVTSNEAADQLDLNGSPAFMELDFAVLEERTRLERPYQPVPQYPATQRDLAVVVSEDVLWRDIDTCVREHAPETLEVLELFDVYRGEGVAEGQKSVAFSLTFRREDRTITSEEAEEAREAILGGLRDKLGATLR
ncbi:MAG: phenylalanine--tRNA ligase subunit beta [Candidatus Brocadiia bacterium]